MEQQDERKRERLVAEAECQARIKEAARKKAQRKRRQKRYHQKTKSGQPVMRGMIDTILERLHDDGLR